MPKDTDRCSWKEGSLVGILTAMVDKVHAHTDIIVYQLTFTGYFFLIASLCRHASPFTFLFVIQESRHFTFSLYKLNM